MQNFSDFGDDMVETLVEHYNSHFTGDNAVATAESIKAEWPLLRNAVFEV